MIASHPRLFCVCVCMLMIASISGPANVLAEDHGDFNINHDLDSVKTKNSHSIGINQGRGGRPLQGDTDLDGIPDDEERDTPYISRRFSFELNSEEWTAESFWGRSEMLSFSPMTSYRCRREIGSPDNYLTSPSMDMPNVDTSEVLRLQVTFWYFAEFYPDPLEYGELQINDGSGWSTLKTYDFMGPSQSMPFDVVDITSYAGQSIQLRFNYHQLQIVSPLLGWFVDEVRIVGYTNPLNPDTDSDELGTDEAMNDFNELDVSRTSQRFSFEGSDQGWTRSPPASWERTTQESDSPQYSFHSVRDGFQATTGTLTSPGFKLPMSPMVELKFSYLLDAHSFDIGKVGMKVIGGGGNWEDPTYRTPVGDNPHSVFVGDADNDGDNDIVVGDSGTNYVYIYLWEGDDWAQPITRSVGGHPRSVFVADADNDGDNDIVTSFWWNDGVSILRWNGLDWDLEIRWGLYNAGGVFVADVDNDGDNDIAVADMGLDQVSILPWEVLLADWGAWIHIPVGHFPVSVFVTDIDNDNDNDIAVANSGDDTVTILKFPGWIPETEAVGDGPNWIFVNDADNDGDMDVITPNYYDDTVSILRQIPGVGWNHDSRTVGSHPASVFVDDVDEDGDNDLVVSDQHSHTISIMRWDGSDWNPRETLDVSQYPAGVFIADADNDGDNDIVNTNLLPGSVSIFKWTGNPNFLRGFTNIDNTAVWTDVSFDVSQFADDYVQIVFEYMSFQDGGVTEEGWFIDDVKIDANTNPLNEDTDADGRYDGLEAGETWEAQKCTYEAGDEGWWLDDEPNNLWERTSDEYSPESPSYSFHCGRDDTDEIESLLISQWFSLPMTDNLILTFAYWWDPMLNDRARLMMEVDGGEWNTLWGYYGYDSSIPHESWELSNEIDISMYGGETVRFSFNHKSKAGSSSTYEGWYVDYLIVKGTTNPVKRYTDAESVSDGEETSSVYKLRMYSFEYDSEGWTTSNYWKQMTWLGKQGSGHSDVFSMNIGHDGDALTSVLASPGIRLPLSSEITLRFWHKLDGRVCGEDAEVWLSVSGRETSAVKLKDYGSTLSTPFDWTEEITQIPSWGDEIVGIKFYYTSKNCDDPHLYPGWFVDGVTIEAVSNPLKTDTDGDGLSDYSEMANMYDGEGYDFNQETEAWEVLPVPGSLWEIATAHGHTSYHCGRDSMTTTTNDLQSRPMRLPMSATLEVSFSHWWDPKVGDDADLSVEVLYRDWSYVEVVDVPWSDTPLRTWVQKTGDISEYAGEVVRFRFRMYSVAGNEATYEGWYVDDFLISGLTNPIGWDTDEDNVGDYSEIAGFESGYVVNSNGFEYETSPVLWDTDLDGAGDGYDPVPLDWDMDGDGTPNDSDSDMDEDGLLTPDDPDNDNDGMSDEYEMKYGVEGSLIGGGGWQSWNIHNRRYAFLVTGGSTYGSSNWPAFWNDIKAVLSKLVVPLVGYDFDVSDTYVLGWDHTGERDGITLYGPTTREYYFRFLDEMRLKMTKNDLLFAVHAVHTGSTSIGVLTDDLTGATSISYEESGRSIRGELFRDLVHDGHHSRKSPINFARKVFVYWGCEAAAATEHITGENSIVAMSSETCCDSYAKINPLDSDDRSHLAFLYEGTECNPFPLCVDHPGFALSMGSKTNPKSMKYAFDKGYYAATHNYAIDLQGGLLEGRSWPQLEDNNNGLTEEDEDTDDGELSQKTFI